MSDPHTEKAKQIIEENIFMTIATASKTGEPWVTPVNFAFDDTYQFFWVSAREAHHSQFIHENPLVSLVIFNSSVSKDAGKGVYIQAKATELDQEKDITEAANIYFSRQQKPVLRSNHFMWESPKRIYKAIPEKFWINTGEYIGEYFIDERVEVFPHA